MNKTCNKCQVKKSENDFARLHCAKDGLQSMCRACRKIEITAWRVANPEKVRAYRKLHAAERREKKREWAVANPDKVRAYGRRRYHTVEKHDPIFMTIKRLRQRYTMALKRGGVQTLSALQLLGCDIPTLWAHVEKQFVPGMTRENWGKGLDKWQLDHIKPVSAFDCSDPEQVRVCFHYTNLQPLWAPDNNRKRDHWTPEMAAAHPGNPITGEIVFAPSLPPPPEPTSKACRICTEEKPIGEFRIRADTKRRRTECITCWRFKSNHGHFPTHPACLLPS